MERLDQGHLHPKLEVPRLTCLSQSPYLQTFYGDQESISSLAGRYDNPIFRTGQSQAT